MQHPNTIEFFLLIILAITISNIVTTVSVNPSIKLVANPIPIVINAKKITNSNGFLTGFRNLTIDSAPIIPKDNAILPEINTVIIIVTTGKSA